MRDRFRENIKRLMPTEHYGHVISALSGGADSVAMTILFTGLAAEMGFSLSAIHINHMLRGKEADRDEAFVREFCEKLRIDLRVIRRDVPSFAVCRGISFEEAAREVRYEEFERAATEIEADGASVLVATAHNMGDSVETFLFNLFRGTGAKGLSGIPERRGRYIRPMLIFERGEIEDFLKTIGADHVTDSTNFDTAYARNRIRSVILPEAEGLFPGAVRHIGNAANLIRADAEYLQGEAKKALSSARSSEGIDIRVIRDLPDPILSRVLMIAAECDLGITPGRQHVLALTELSRTGRTSDAISLPGGEARIHYGKLRFSRPNDGKIEYLIPLTDGENVIPEVGNVIVERVPGNIINKLLINEHIDCGKIMDTIFARNRLVGDRFSLPGGSKSVKKLFIDRKIPAYRRDRIPIVADGGGTPVFIPGFGASSKVLPDRDTVSALRITFVPDWD